MDDSLEKLVARELDARRVVLAVSGGRDSMSLMHAAASRARDAVTCVATFDHATGAHSAAAEQYAHYAAYLREELGLEPPPLASL